MKCVLAPDSFKESMSARQAAQAMEDGVRDVFPDAVCVQVPMSDGGEGFVDAVARAWGASRAEVDTLDALGRPLRASYAFDGRRAVMDIASCVGLELIDPAERDVWASSTTGVGLMLADALNRGARHILIGIGGSATNDAGAGMLVALGAQLRDDRGEAVSPCPAELGRVESVDASGLMPQLADVQIEVACDVDNPLGGQRGASAVFGLQKGAQAGDIARLDALLMRFAAVGGHRGIADEAGSGAAGGLGFALRAFLGAQLRPGVEMVAQAVDLAAQVRGADLVMTGEGSVDSQTLRGKTPAGVAAVAAGEGVPCVVYAGRIRPGAQELKKHGVTDLVKIGSDEEPLEVALRRGRVNLRRAVADYLRQAAAPVK